MTGIYSNRNGPHGGHGLHQVFLTATGNGRVAVDDDGVVGRIVEALQVVLKVKEENLVS